MSAPPPSWAGRPPAAGRIAWHAQRGPGAAVPAGRRGSAGSLAEAAARERRSGPDKLAEGKAGLRWQAFARQYRDPMQIGLLAAGIGSIYRSGR
jgi:P-type Ca2+ transporter type 2C